MTSLFWKRSALSCYFAMMIFVFSTVVNAQVVLYDGAAGDTVGFTFDSFTDGLTETGSSFLIDVESFGGCGTDIAEVSIDDVTAQLRVVYRVLGDNTAADFDVALRDNDGDDSGPGLGSEEFVFRLAVDAGTPTGTGFDEQIVPLNSFLFRQASFGFTNDGDGLINFGLDQWKVQSMFGSTDRLNVEIERIEIVTSDSVSIYNGCAGDTIDFTFDSFIFGLEETGTSFTVDVDSFGGCGRGFGQLDVDAASSQLRVVYQVLGNNTASQFQILLQDNDGDDTGPGLGNEEFLYPFLFENGTPLGDGSGFEEQSVGLTDWVFRQQSFGFINDGDMEPNYGAVQWNMQSEFGSTETLNVEIKSIEIAFAEVKDCLLGDVNLDGGVDLLDVAPFVNLISLSEFQKEADVNEDGMVTLLDVGPFVDLLTGG